MANPEENALQVARRWRRARSKTIMQIALAGRLRPSGLPALRPRPDARGAALRHERARAARRPDPAQRGPRHRRPRARVDLRLDDRRPRLPPRASRAAAARVDRPQGPGDARPRPGGRHTRTPGSRPTAAASSSTSARTSDKGDLWIRDFARRHDHALHVRAGARVRAGLVAGREADRLFGAAEEAGPLRKDAAGTGEPELLLENDEDKFVTDWSQRRDYSSSRAAARQNWDLWAMRHDGRPQALPAPEDQVRRLNGTPLTRRTLPRVPVERVGPQRDLRAGVPGGTQQVAGLAERRPRAVLAGGRPRALLPRPRRRA